MKAKRLLGRTLLVSVVCGGLLAFSGCRADVDFNNLDTTAEVEFGVALPIGSMGVTLGDLLGTGSIDNLYYSSDGTLCLHGDYTKDEAFHPLDLSAYLSNAEEVIPMYEAYTAAVLASQVSSTYSFSVTAPISLEYEGINNDVSYERIDSAHISRAEVEGYLLAENEFPISFEWIDKITLEFGKEFKLKKSNTHVLYDKSVSSGGIGYGTLIPIDLESFVLDLVKDHSLPPSNDNVVNSSEMQVVIDFTLPADAQKENLNPNMAVVFGMNVKFIDYDAVWGMFEASKYMRDEEEMSMDSVFSNWSLFKELRLPLAEPLITINISHRLAGPVFFYGNYLYVRSNDGQEQYAEFGSDGSHSAHYPREVSSNIEEMYHSWWLDPNVGTINDTASIPTITFDNTPENGHIDKLFAVHPDHLGWSFQVDFDPTIVPQARITPNTDVHMDIDLDIPFIFNEGTHITFKDTLPNINLTSANLDSLSGGFVDSITQGDVFLKVQIENTLPLDLRLVLRCLDADGNVLTDSNTGEPIRLSESDTILVVAPKFRQEGDEFVISEAGTTNEVLRISKDTYEDIDAIKNITFELVLDDRSLHPTFSEYPDFKARITKDAKVRIGLGIGAKAGVVLKLTDDNE